jgi:micrococcal nuclease
MSAMRAGGVRGLMPGLVMGLLLGLMAAVMLPGLAIAARAPSGVPGTVTKVIDGDTVWVTLERGGEPLKVRLAGIDAPEICQEGGTDAQAYLSELVLNQRVRLAKSPGAAGRDKHGRTVGTLWLDSIEVNRRMVEEGQAWSVRYKWDRGPYVPQERMARALSRGVHRTGSAAIMPRDFRQRHGPCR